MKYRNPRIILGAAVLAVTGHHLAASAADHTDSPGASDDPAADIADLYAWQSAEGRLTLILTYAPFGEAGVGATYDAQTLYGVHVDTDGDNEADHDIWVRFGQNDQGDWGVQAMGLPGEAGAIEGAVGSNLEGSAGGMLFAGLREDPFFFDFEGFGDTLATGTLSFDGTRDSVAGTNVTSVVVEFDTEELTGGPDAIQIWATASRKN